MRPQSGTFVFKPSFEELKALCELRTALELEALLLATQRNLPRLQQAMSRICDRMIDALKAQDQNLYQQLDSAFHMAFIENAQSPLLAATFTSRVNGRFSALRYRFSRSAEHNENSISEHLQLRDLIRSGDIDKARKALRPAREAAKKKRRKG